METTATGVSSFPCGLTQQAADQLFHSLRLAALRRFAQGGKLGLGSLGRLGGLRFALCFGLGQGPLGLCFGLRDLLVCLCAGIGLGLCGKALRLLGGLFFRGLRFTLGPAYSFKGFLNHDLTTVFYKIRSKISEKYKGGCCAGSRAQNPLASPPSRLSPEFSFSSSLILLSHKEKQKTRQITQNFSNTIGHVVTDFTIL